MTNKQLNDAEVAKMQEAFKSQIFSNPVSMAALAQIDGAQRLETRKTLKAWGLAIMWMLWFTWIVFPNITFWLNIIYR